MVPCSLNLIFKLIVHLKMLQNQYQQFLCSPHSCPETLASDSRPARRPEPGSAQPAAAAAGVCAVFPPVSFFCSRAQPISCSCFSFSLSFCSWSFSVFWLAQSLESDTLLCRCQRAQPSVALRVPGTSRSPLLAGSQSRCSVVSSPVFATVALGKFT